MTNGRFAPAFSLTLLVFGLLVSVIIFVDVQVMSGVYHIGSVTLSSRGFPWWTEQVTKQTCFFGPGPDDNCGFLNYGQALAISLSVSFFALLAWLYLHEASASKERRLLRAAGLSLLSFGLLIATVVFAEVQVMNSTYRVGALTLRFEGFPFGGQEVLGSGCILGSDPLNCYFFNYDQLLLLAAVGTFVGLFLWLYSRDEGSSQSPPRPERTNPTDSYPRSEQLIQIQTRQEVYSKREEIPL